MEEIQVKEMNKAVAARFLDFAEDELINVLKLVEQATAHLENSESYANWQIEKLLSVAREMLSRQIKDLETEPF